MHWVMLAGHLSLFVAAICCLMHWLTANKNYLLAAKEFHLVALISMLAFLLTL